jgi:hypothetical protein
MGRLERVWNSPWRFTTEGQEREEEEASTAKSKFFEM